MNLFKPGDFLHLRDTDGVGSSFVRDEAARMANARFETWLAEQPEVFGNWVANAGELGIISCDTHRARLVAIEKIEKIEAK